jgi:ArsR family transcriptional regulator
VQLKSNEIVRVYKCLCDLTRLRILNLLIEGPLCVCHIQSILRTPEPKISRLLNLMKRAGLVASNREYNWSIYRIADRPSLVLTSNLKCLLDVRSENKLFFQDLINRRKTMDRLIESGACLPKSLSKSLAPCPPSGVNRKASSPNKTNNKKTSTTRST